MLRRSDGYFLAEMLLSLSAWLVVTSVLLPGLVHLRDQTAALQVENTAIHLLYDELERAVEEGVPAEPRSIELNGINYEIHWGGEMSRIEVCVEYQDERSKRYKKCKMAEQ
jgi:competence protein ComGE